MDRYTDTELVDLARSGMKTPLRISFRGTTGACMDWPLSIAE